jgi:hypothetical protein
MMTIESGLPAAHDDDREQGRKPGVDLKTIDPLIKRLGPLLGLLLLGLPAASPHDDSLGARFVDSAGANASDCLEHHEPCRTIQYALAQAGPGNATDTMWVTDFVRYPGA